jgi:hypothetical protein
VFENRVLGGITGPKWEKLREDWRKCVKRRFIKSTVHCMILPFVGWQPSFRGEFKRELLRNLEM